jgi:hypothetical protein
MAAEEDEEWSAQALERNILSVEEKFEWAVSMAF